MLQHMIIVLYCGALCSQPLNYIIISRLGVLDPPESQLIIYKAQIISQGKLSLTFAIKK